MPDACSSTQRQTSVSNISAHLPALMTGCLRVVGFACVTSYRLNRTKMAISVMAQYMGRLLA